MEKLKILCIGDIHGRDNWKEWIKEEADFYVFVGDYVDSFDKTNVEILENLKDIISFKQANPLKVILLLGNHCNQYYLDNPSMMGHRYRCSGYRPEMAYDLYDLYQPNRDLFQACFQIDKYVWTHAGISRGWWGFQYKHPFEYNLEVMLNESFLQREESLFDVGHLRGGYKNVGGIFWADKRETFDKPLLGIHQIVGHTPIKEPTTYYLHNDINSDTSITYIDCENKPYILEINE